MRVPVDAGETQVASQPDGRRIVRGKPYICVKSAISNAVKAARMRQSRRVFG